MHKLTFYSTDITDELAQPTHAQSVTTASSALEVFTDFSKVTPLVVHPELSALETERLMQSSHVRLKMVVDNNNHFLGVISLDDLNHQEVIKRISHGYRRSDLRVADFMRPRESLKAFSYDDLAKASIQDVIDALEENGHHHCLVIDRNSHEIRGIISASDIARKLKLPVKIGEQSNFATLSKVIYNQIHPSEPRLVGVH